MNRLQLENIYLANGLDDFKLRNTEDLLKAHGIDFKAVDGYEKLDDLNKAIYKRFIVNFFNGQGLDYRNIVPKGIYFVEETEYLVKEPHIDGYGDEYFDYAGEKIVAINKDGSVTIHKYSLDKKYEGVELITQKPRYYLRIEYTQNGKAEWLHIINDGKEWY